jgi:hypothetical protein
MTDIDYYREAPWAEGDYESQRDEWPEEDEAEQLQWLAAHGVSSRLLRSYFIRYDEVETYFAYTPHWSVRGALCAPREKRVGGWLRKGLAWLVGWFWGWPRRPSPPVASQPSTRPQEPLRPFQYNTKG